VIVTADDFGLSAEVNEAILEAFRRGFISATSVMANMPGFEPACEIAHEYGLTGQVGSHLVLTEGEPLSDGIRSCRRFCDSEGRFRYWRGSDRALRLSRLERTAVERELRMQILRCRDRGLEVAHLDSHHHVHNKHAIGSIVISIAQELAIRRVRLAHNAGARTGLANRASKAWLNRSLRRKGLAATRWFGGIEDYLRLRTTMPAAKLDSFEIVTHPVLREGLLVDAQHPDRPLQLLLDWVAAIPA
jgi:predicted glycoside hydrolase/deacetylase ChbG (UPF0249 family)